jgi:hypothetical protein
MPPRSGTLSSLRALACRLRPRHILTWDQGNELAHHEQVGAHLQDGVFFAYRASRGCAARTRTPTACCASTSRRAAISPCTGRGAAPRAGPAQQPTPQDPRLADPSRGLRWRSEIILHSNVATITRIRPRTRAAKGQISAALTGRCLSRQGRVPAQATSNHTVSVADAITV